MDFNVVSTGLVVFGRRPADPHWLRLDPTGRKKALAVLVLKCRLEYCQGMDVVAAHVHISYIMYPICPMPYARSPAVLALTRYRRLTALSVGKKSSPRHPYLSNDTVGTESQRADLIIGWLPGVPGYPVVTWSISIQNPYS